MKRYLVSWIAGALVLSCFTMCTKKVNKIEKPLNPETGQTTQTPGQNTGTADPSADPSDDEVKATYAIGECTYTVQPSQWVVDGANIPAGSVVCIPAGTRGALLFKNLKGTETAPIVIMNKGGKVNFTVAATASYALKTQNCRYFKILGIGDAATKYGFNVNGGNISVTLDDLSSDFEISFVEVRNSGFAGIMAKTDPSCDIATQRGHFTMKNISLHHNYVHKTGGEGFYVGNSFYADGRPLACGTVLPHDVVNVKIYKNMIDSAGCEGIQVGSAIAGCEVYKNTIRMPGLSPFANGQDNGIQIGEGTGGVCYANLIEKAPGDGIIVLGLGDNLVYNNIILNAGEHGIFADSRYTPGPNFKFINNTIISPALNGVKLNSETIPMNTVINNVIISPGAGVAIARKSTAVKLTASNNYTGTDVSLLMFTDYAKKDFHLLPASPLINAGANVLLYGVYYDFYGKLHTAANAFDIGATEY